MRTIVLVFYVSIWSKTFSYGASQGTGYILDVYRSPAPALLPSGTYDGGILVPLPSAQVGSEAYLKLLKRKVFEPKALPE